MTPYESEYRALLSELVDRLPRHTRKDRTGVGASSVVHRSLHSYLRGSSVPLLKGKSVHVKSVVGELCWFLSGSTNVHDLRKYGVTIWDEWAGEDGQLGPTYGAQWRGHGDQIRDVIHLLRREPTTRRAVVSAWEPARIGEMVLPPCHVLFQFQIHEGKLILDVYQRSADIFLGVPFNMASYGILAHIVAAATRTHADSMRICFGDLHLYSNHEAAAREYQKRLWAPGLPDRHMIPRVILPSDELAESSFDDPSDFLPDGRFGPKSFPVVDYSSLPAIAAPVAV
ncbi:MAG: thymidylate synthase [Giesbergeria sp.]